MHIKAAKLKTILSEALERVNNFNDNVFIQTHPNTYGIDGPNILETRDGFLDLDNIERADDQDEDD